MKNRWVILLLAPTIMLLQISVAQGGIWGDDVQLTDFNDQRTFSAQNYAPSSSEGGLEGYWPYSFTLEWAVARDPETMLWTYEYTLSSDKKDVSHFILELDSGTTRQNFYGMSINGEQEEFGDDIEGPSRWDSHQGNPSFPAGTDIFGIKFDKGEGATKYAITTDLHPVWGNFYAKGGKDKGRQIYANNEALGLEDFNSNDKLDFIARPGGTVPVVVPEPLGIILFVSGGIVLAGRRYLKRRNF